MASGETGRCGELLVQWRIVAACFAGLILAVGTIVTYSAGVFSVAIGRDFGWTSADFALPIMFFYYSLVPGSILCGHLVDRFGPQRLILSSNIGLALGLANLSLLPPSLPLFCLGYAAIGLVSIGTLPVTYARVIAGRFDKSRGAALGIALTGVGIGSAILPALAQGIIDQGGWRTAMACLAGLVMLFGYTSAWAYIPPEVPRRTNETSGVNAIVLAWNESRRAVLGLGTISLVCGVVLTGLVVNMAPLAISKGMDHSGVITVGIAMGASVITGRLGIGILMDRYPAKIVLGLFLLGPVFGAILLAVQADSTILLVAVVLVGLAQGAEVDAVAYLVSRHFDPGSFGVIYGLMFALFTIGAANGPLLLAQFHLHWGRYDPGLYMYALLAALCTLLSFLLPSSRLGCSFGPNQSQ
jgi:MFS family permease